MRAHTHTHTHTHYTLHYTTLPHVLYNFGVKYWNVVDQDGSSSLSYDEYKYTMAAFAATDAQVILKGFDSNTDGILSGSELSSFRSFVEGALASNDWNPSASDVAAIKAAWANAQVDGDDNTASLLELAKFTVGAWNVLLA